MDVQTIQQLHQDPTLRNRVAKRAYELFIRRGRQMGDEAEDWFQAESEILQEVIEQKQHIAIAEAAFEPQIQPQVQNKEQVFVLTNTSSTSTVDNTTAKKRTYTRKKKATDNLTTEQEVTVAESATKEVTPETTTAPRTRRTRSKANEASDIV
ncbi:MAG: hypothetical protein FD167_4502 [bacterium]|nr:MAG: hypothetical protein FD167_4502 [bacterium]